MLRLASRALLDLCFPPRCIACDAQRWDLGAFGLCPPCARDLEPLQARCGACGRRVGPYEAGPGCARCAGPGAESDALRWSGDPGVRPRRAVYGVVAGWSYGGVARDLVLALKFQARPQAARPLAAQLVEALRVARVPGDLVTPIPLARARRRQRGYDQALLLARHVARALGLELAPHALRRIRNTVPQSSLSRSARARGPRGAFEAAPRPVRGRCVLLVDDVLTTGATARSCAVALRRAGALSVTVAAACRA